MKSNRDKTDQGVQVAYWSLSYRRKFIRTLWCIPFVIAVAIYLWLSTGLGIATMSSILLLVTINTIQLVYTYIKWKTEEGATKSPNDQVK